MSQRILIVDDDPAIREVLARQLKEYEVVTAGTADEALSILRKNGLGAVIADVRMPGMDGVALLETVRRTRPDVARFLLTAFSDSHALAAATAPEGAYRFKKPWGDELLITVRRALENRQTILTLRRRLGLLINWMEMAPDLASRNTPEDVLGALGRWLERIPGVSGVDVYIVRPASLECVCSSGALKDVPLCKTDNPLVRSLHESRLQRRHNKKLEVIRCIGQNSGRAVVRLLIPPDDAEVACLIDQTISVASLALRAVPIHAPGPLPLDSDLRLLQRQAALGGLFSSVIHELNNPLGAVLAHMEMLQTDCRDHPAVCDHLDVLLPQIERIASILDRARKLARPTQDQLEAIDLRHTLEPVVALLDYNFRNLGCDISVRLPDSPVMVRGSSSLLQQVWLNLLKNSCEAITSSSQRPGSISVTVQSVGHRARLAFTDDGVGMTPEVLDRLRSRPEFFTTKPEGLGLGIYESRRIVIQHGGTLDYESKPDRGTTVVVTLPLLGKS